MCKNCKSSMLINYNYVCIEPKQRRGIVRSSFKCKGFGLRVNNIYIKADR